MSEQSDSLSRIRNELNRLRLRLDISPTQGRLGLLRCSDDWGVPFEVEAIRLLGILQQIPWPNDESNIFWKRGGFWLLLDGRENLHSEALQLMKAEHDRRAGNCRPPLPKRKERR